MKPWTTAEVRYMTDHRYEGAEAVADALGRSVSSVCTQASRYGISLRQRWECPRCGDVTFKPLNPKTGWCASCSKAKRREELEEELRDLTEQQEREKREDRARQALYSRKNRLIRRNDAKQMQNEQEDG